MNISKLYLWILLPLCLLSSTLPGQTFDFTLGSDEICQGSVIELTVVDIVPPVSPTYYYNWSILTPSDADGMPDQLFDNARNPGTGSGEGADFSYVRLALAEAGITEVFFQLPNGSRISQTINVVKSPVAGQGNTVFLCNKTGTLNLFDQIDGNPDSGGVWTYVDRNDGSPRVEIDGIFDIDGGDEPNIFTYTVAGTSPCPDSDTKVIVRACVNNDYDNDGIPNVDDLDNDNDGILDVDENSVCSALDLTPTQISLDEDFGIGPPTQNRYVSPILTYQIGIPQDINGNDGEYNVATSTYIYNFNNESANYVSTNANGFLDGDGNIDGRFLSINMKTSSFLNGAIYEQTDLPVTSGVLNRLSMKVVNLNDNGGLLPNLTLQILDESDVVLQSVDSGDIPFDDDKWITYDLDFVPAAGISVVKLRVINRQLTSGNGNDVGIDNILLSRLECDFDNDGIPNYLDLDSDNDGIYDSVEAGFLESQVQPNGQLTGGYDADGVPLIAAGGVALTNDNYLNLDSDGDGCSDANEAYYDAEADGLTVSTNTGETAVYGIDPFDFADIVDFDGLVIDAPYTYPVDKDGVGGLDYTQAGGPDLNGNSIPDACEDVADHDEDGIPDGIAGADDLDDDNDGILDTDENGGVDPFGDADSDGIFDYMDTDIAGFTDVNSDGIDDKFDQDLDGWINQFDNDADGDGIFDFVEEGQPFVVITGDSGQIGPDSTVNANGVPVEANAGAGLTLSTPLDGGGLPNFLDLDADGDGIPDNHEAQSTGAYVAPSGVDSNDNGVDDAYDNAGAIDPFNTNTSSAPDFVNLNSDDDCLSDNIEAFDFDEDGVADVDRSSDPPAVDGWYDSYKAAFTTIADLPNNHNPNTPEVDYREEYVEIVEEVDDPEVLCENDDPFLLFSMIDTLTTNENGLWTGPAITSTGEAFDWELDPSVTGAAGEYVYTLPQLGTCPLSTFTVTVNITELPFTGLDNPSVVPACSSDTTFSLYDNLLPDGTVLPDINGVWTSTDTTVLPISYNGTLDLTTIPSTQIGFDITYTYRVGSATCFSETDVVINLSSNRNAGVADTVIDPICITETSTNNLFTYLTGAESGGSWSSTDDTVTNFTGDSLGVINPSLLTAGTYVYTYELAPIGSCLGDSETVEIEILAAPNAGNDNTEDVCFSEREITLSDYLEGTPDTTGVWLYADDTEIGDYLTATVDTENITSGDEFTYKVGTDTCFAEAVVTINIIESPNPGAQVNPIVVCGSSNDVVDLFAALEDADVGGTWSEGNGTVVPSSLTAGDYEYTYTLTGTNGCPDAESKVAFTVTPILNAGTNAEITLCRENVSIDLFDYLGVDAMIGGTWVSESGNITFTGDRGTLSLADTNVLDEDRYTYTVTSSIDGGCEDATAFIDLQLTEDRDAGADPTPIVVCTSERSSIDLFSELEITDTDGSWTGGATEGGYLGTFLITDTTPPGDYTFVYTLPAIGTCEADEVTVALTVVTATTPTNPTNEEVCEGDSNPQLSVTVDAGLTANWYFGAEDGPLVQANSSTYIPTETNVGGYTYYVYSYSAATGCESSEFVRVQFTVHGIFPIDLPAQEIVCEGDIVTIPSGLSEADFNIQWFKDNVEIAGATGASYDATEPGSYFVEYESRTLSNSSTGDLCTQQSANSTRVTQIVPASNLQLTLVGEGFSNFNSITAIFDGDPNGEYEIDLDGTIFRSAEPNKPVVFENLSPGRHFITVADLNGCGDILEDNRFVIGFPKFFTPNGDNANEEWNVVLDPSQPMDLDIFVYDRFGKLIQQVFPNKPGGWDGTFAGKNMPSDDYWFLATMKDTGETYASHFTLLR